MDDGYYYYYYLIKAARDESHKINPETALNDARDLLRAGELILGTEESTFSAILSQRNKSQLKLIFTKYQYLTGRDFETAIVNEFSGTTKAVILALVKSIKDPTDYFALGLYDGMNRITADHTTLIRILVSRSETDLNEIKYVFFGKYGKSLTDFIQNNTSGDYKKCLLSVLD